MSKKILIYTEDEHQAALPAIERAVEKISGVSADVIIGNIQNQISAFEGIFETNRDYKNFDIEAIRLKFIVDASGEVKLLGKVKAGVAASIEISLSPRTEK